MDRFFVFFYSALNGDKGLIALGNETFPKHRDIIDEVCRRISANKNDICITGWEELSKDDFSNFVSGDLRGDSNGNN